MPHGTASPVATVSTTVGGESSTDGVLSPAGLDGLVVPVGDWGVAVTVSPGAASGGSSSLHEESSAAERTAEVTSAADRPMSADSTQELPEQAVDAVGVLHLEEVRAAELDVRRVPHLRGGRRHRARAGEEVPGARDEHRRCVDPAEPDPGVTGGVEGDVGVPLDRGLEERRDRPAGE